jgi:signal transduction histidine kinase
MKTMTVNSTRYRLLKIPQLFTTIALFVAGLLDIHDPFKRGVAAVLLVIFAIILFAPYFWHYESNRVHAGLAILTALSTVLIFLSPGWSFFPILFFLLAPMAMIHLPGKAGWIWVGSFALITGIELFLSDGMLGLAYLLVYSAGYVFFGIFGRVTVESERNRLHAEQLLAELQDAHRQLQVYATQVEELAVAQERNRIAREMHDTLGHRLTIAAVQLEGAQRLIPTHPERAAAIVGTVREQVKEGLTDLRRTVAMLRASVEEDLPLDTALTRLADQVQQATSLAIHLSLEDCPQNISLAQHQALYRAAQEALTNIQRHARASEAWLQLTVQNGAIKLLVSDNGVGLRSEPDKTGFGLLGLQERAALQGGEFHVDARAGGGTQITFQIPLTPAAQPAIKNARSPHE